jgi:hypothetical protein
MRRWSILIKDHSFLGWLREKILGTYTAIECDNLIITPPGYFEVVFEDTNTAEYFWFKDVISWCCNKDYHQLTAEANDKIIEQMKHFNQQTNDIDMNTLSNTPNTIGEEAMFG